MKSGSNSGPDPYVDLEPRPLPSTGVNRLHRYYGPLRLPRRPGLSLAGIRLGHAPTAWGLPCCVDLRVPTCRRHYPGGTTVRMRRSLKTVTAAFPVSVPGRLPHQKFRGLHGVHSRYGLLARGAACATLCIRSFGSIVTSTAVPIATGWNDSCRVGIAPTEDRHLCTAHTDTIFLHFSFLLSPLTSMVMVFVV